MITTGGILNKSLHYPIENGIFSKSKSYSTNTIHATPDNCNGQYDNTNVSFNLNEKNLEDTKKGPRHVAFICDGNSRWTKQSSQTTTTQQHEQNQQQQDIQTFIQQQMKGKSVMIGHTKGASRVLSTIQYIHQQNNHCNHHPNNNNKNKTRINNIQYVTLYAFSTENWNRSQSEIQDLFQIIYLMILQFESWLKKERIRVKILGDLEDDRIPNHVRNALLQLERDTSHFINEECVNKEEEQDSSSTVSCNNLTLCIAVNYGGRWDILNATKQLVSTILLQQTNPLSSHNNNNDILVNKNIIENNITEQEFEKALCTCGIPNPDLIIRTGGEKRLSNFLTWNSAYSELYFSDVLWPDFDEVELEKALEWFMGRERRYGGRK